MRHSVESFDHIYTSHEDSMRVWTVKVELDVVEEFNKVVGNRRLLKPSTLSWVQIGLHKRKKPVTQEGFILFTEEGGPRNVPDILQ